jgi:hypothetical protein
MITAGRGAAYRRRDVDEGELFEDVPFPPAERAERTGGTVLPLNGPSSSCKSGIARSFLNRVISVGRDFPVGEVRLLERKVFG